MSKEICILNGTKWILGDESTEPMNWEDANKWCKSIGQDLPPREVLMMAFLNPEIRKKFSHDYYWSSSEYDTYFAWGQYFDNGYQDYVSKTNTCLVRAVRAISAEASEQNEQEPVAWIDGGIGGGTAVGWYDKDIIDLPKGTKLYTHPPKREPLSDETICEILLKKEWKGFVELVRQIERLHGIGVE